MSATGHAGPQEIIPRTRDTAEIKYVAGRKKYDLPKVKQRIQQLLDESLEQTILECEIWINSKVPKLTGALRESLLHFLRRSRPPRAGELIGIRLIMGVGSDITYAKYVNKMPTAWVRHAIDPRAEGFYHEKMVNFGKERFRFNVDKARYKFQVEG